MEISRPRVRDQCHITNGSRPEKPVVFSGGMRSYKRHDRESCFRQGCGYHKQRRLSIYICTVVICLQVRHCKPPLFFGNDTPFIFSLNKSAKGPARPFHFFRCLCTRPLWMHNGVITYFVTKIIFVPCVIYYCSGEETQNLLSGAASEGAVVEGLLEGRACNVKAQLQSSNGRRKPHHAEVAEFRVSCTSVSFSVERLCLHCLFRAFAVFARARGTAFRKQRWRKNIAGIWCEMQQSRERSLCAESHFGVSSFILFPAPDFQRKKSMCGGDKASTVGRPSTIHSSIRMHLCSIHSGSRLGRPDMLVPPMPPRSLSATGRCIPNVASV